MKATGIVRRIDDLGRVVVPKEIRRTMRIREGQAMHSGAGCNLILTQLCPWVKGTKRGGLLLFGIAKTAPKKAHQRSR